MAAGITRIVMLAVFSGLSMNLILQLGIGIRKIVLIQNGDTTADAKDAVSKMAVLFISSLFLWLFFSFIRSLMPLGFVEYILLFPSAYFFSSVSEYVLERFVLKKNATEGNSVQENRMINGALTAAALFVALNVGGSFWEAAVVSLCFSAGNALAILIINEIRLRAEMEAVPTVLRGSPLVLVALGLLSLIFSSAALLLYQVLGSN
jgi:electron transport complex protein RnfA